MPAKFYEIQFISLVAVMVNSSVMLTVLGIVGLFAIMILA